MHKLENLKDNYLDLGYDIDDSKARVKIVVEF